MNEFFQITENILQLVFPPRCLFCDEVVAIGVSCCVGCEETCKRLKLTGDDRTGFDTKTLGHLQGVIASFLYAEEVANVVARYKFRGQPELFRAMARYMADDADFLKDAVDIVTFVPGYRSRHQHARQLAKGVAGRLETPMRQLLVKTRNTKTQHSLGAQDRKKNIRGAFSAKRGAEIEGKVILLCDDVVTSGNTMNTCAAVLCEAGAKVVYGCAFSATG